MRKFIVPQFIDVENKILGPVTVRQFITVAVGGVFIFVAYRLADFALFLIWTVVIAGISAVVAFVRFNGLPFHIFMLNMVSTYKKPMLRVWMKEEVTTSTVRSDEKRRKKGKKKDEEDRYFVPRKSVTTSRLSELALIIDTGGIYKGEAEANRINQSLYAK